MHANVLILESFFQHDSYDEYTIKNKDIMHGHVILLHINAIAAEMNT